MLICSSGIPPLDIYMESQVPSFITNNNEVLIETPLKTSILEIVLVITFHYT